MADARKKDLSVAAFLGSRDFGPCSAEWFAAQQGFA